MATRSMANPGQQQLGCGVPNVRGCGRTLGVQRDRVVATTGGQNTTIAGPAELCPQGATAAARTGQEKGQERRRQTTGQGSGYTTATTHTAVQRPRTEEENG